MNISCNALVEHNVFEFRVLNSNSAIKLIRKFGRNIFNARWYNGDAFGEEISGICLENFYLAIKLITFRMKL